jgi:hypothetical protein
VRLTGRGDSSGQAGESQAQSFEKVLNKELLQIAAARRERFGSDREEPVADRALVGLALSGGGVRSATFGLGVLQGLARSGLLKQLDYLSSTGGGGHISGFLATWIRYSGYHAVEDRLAGSSSTAEPPEIQELRQTTLSPLNRGISNSSSATFAWLRNVALNLTALAAVSGALLLLAHGVVTKMEMALRWVPVTAVTALPAVALAAAAAILLAILSLRPEPTRQHSARMWIFWSAILLIMAASTYFSLLINVYAHSSGSPDFLVVWSEIGSVIASFCFLAWFPRNKTVKTLLVHIASAAAAGAAGGLLLSRIPVWIALLISNDAELTPPLIVVDMVLAVLLYLFLMPSASISRTVRGLSARLCRSLLYVAAVWLLVALIWSLPQKTPSVSLLSVLGALVAAIVVIAGGLLNAGGATRVPLRLRGIVDFLERLAPSVFVLALAAAVATALTPLAQPDRLAEAFVASCLLLVIGLFLLWRMRANEFTMHGFQRARLARSYLVPAASAAREHTGRTYDDDMILGDLRDPSVYAGPCPLFGAALDVTETDPSGSPQMRKVPFVFSPLFSGFDPTGSSSGAPGGYRPTKEFAGGVTAATAMAISSPRRDNPPRPASTAIAVLWTIFDLRDGRWVGNPLREDTWDRPGPVSGAAYALLESFARLGNEAAFIRPAAGGAFDNLGIYQLVKRRCRFIIACDASADPTFSFSDLATAIRRCRTELGAEIEMDLGPLARRTGIAGAHCQIAVIHYPAGDAGLMLYVKPSLTGDEPSDLVQYAADHPDFPATYTHATFDEFEFESYRGLGQHIVESLLTRIGSRETVGAWPVEQVFREIRRQLQPDFPAPEAPAAKQQDAPPPELVDAIASGQCVLYAGPGLAAQAKLPTWPAFLDGLLRVAREKSGLDVTGAAGLAASLGAGEFEAVADELIHQVPRELLLEYVRSVTSAPEPSPAHRLLAGMPFLGALNTSFDDLLGAAFHAPVLVPAQTEELVAALQAKARFTVNVLGAASQPASLLFTAKEFRTLLAANMHFQQFLGTLFLRYNVLFVGSSIDGIRDFLEALELPQTPERRHYALVAGSDKLDPVKLRFLERSYNLRVVEFQPQFDFAGLVTLLDQLRSAVSEKAPLAKPAESLILKSVTLENIGPFASLHLDLSPTWNLLLGDNGVGKTVVLRAIAAALCGDKTDPAAVARLLRSGASSGSILLAVEGRQYKVELKRDPSDLEVHIVAASLSPIKYDRWLVLGFPALRSIPWDRPKGPSAPRPEAPSAADLLPILRGEPDQRIADIKQWLVNLDYAAASEPEPSRSKRLIAAFFAVLHRLTPDLRLKLHSIDKKTMEITIETDSGLVPLEAISQGTGSVMCWIGTLLERLAEANSELDLERNTALVLIDEIDAHMHPKWQQLFVSAFREEFKAVQVIATTHSPLLVGSLKPEEIWLLHRAPLRSEIYGVAHLQTTEDGGQEIVVIGPEEEPEEGRPPGQPQERKYSVPAGTELLVKDDEVVEEREPLTKDVLLVAERIVYGQKSLRADQILTGPLFELETTRDPDTTNLLTEYTALMALEHPSGADKEKLAEVAADLQIRLASPQEQAAAQKAYDLIREYARERLKDLPPEKRRQVLAEVKMQLTESITGSRRPD